MDNIKTITESTLENIIKTIELTNIPINFDCLEEETKFPYLINKDMFQISSRQYTGFERGKRYIPLLLNELTVFNGGLIKINKGGVKHE